MAGRLLTSYSYLVRWFVNDFGMLRLSPIVSVEVLRGYRIRNPAHGTSFSAGFSPWVCQEALASYVTIRLANAHC